MNEETQEKKRGGCARLGCGCGMIGCGSMTVIILIVFGLLFFIWTMRPPLVDKIWDIAIGKDYKIEGVVEGGSPARRELSNDIDNIESDIESTTMVVEGEIKKLSARIEALVEVYRRLKPRLKRIYNLLDQEFDKLD